ncbi:hypothetical protein C3942_07685 [Solimonas fluminis]|uniref:Uncharacterized protein n=1 Tax=Solimonas fluminis TaxID=2086571 RepID=A0A2S5TI39_9GAMM|nr:hypothetical protein [Solimonas fluminis]PPE74635.1 hypothetical protein C3942_07685 [Solimonas fluminis]
MRTRAPQHRIPLPLTLMSRPRRSRSKGLAAATGLAALLLAASFYAQEPARSGQAAAPLLATR